MLKRAEPPICVGLYARWGSGKTFMISLLKKEFDPSVYEDPHTHQLLQFFEKGYKKQEPKQAEHTVKALVYTQSPGHHPADLPATCALRGCDFPFHHLRRLRPSRCVSCSGGLVLQAKALLR